MIDESLVTTIGADKPNSLQTLRANISEIVERYEVLTTNLAASVIITSPEHGVLFCSPFTHVLTGYSVEDVFESEGDFLESITVEEDLDRYNRARMVSSIGEDILVRFRIRHRSNINLWLEARMVPICDDEGEVISVMTVAIDVTDTLNYQKQIEEQNQDLNDFSYMISHDLKAPIFTIKGMATALAEDYKDTLGEDGSQLINYILQGASRLEHLVASVLEYSAVSTGTSSEQDIPLALTLNNVMDDFRELINETNAQIILPEDLPIVRGNDVRLYQVFSNLFGNALKYRSPERTPEIRVVVKPHNSQFIIVSVIDNGSGIPKERLEDVLRPFHRAHGSEIEGSGIGLACVKKIVERLGGTINVQSEVGSGSNFSVKLPLPKANPREVPQELARAFE